VAVLSSGGGVWQIDFSQGVELLLFVDLGARGERSFRSGWWSRYGAFEDEAPATSVRLGDSLPSGVSVCRFCGSAIFSRLSLRCGGFWGGGFLVVLRKRWYSLMVNQGMLWSQSRTNSVVVRFRDLSVQRFPVRRSFLVIGGSSSSSIVVSC